MSTTGDTGGDYSYDMAHEDESSDFSTSEPRPADEVPAAGTEEPPDADGDYSYDLAHEVPRSGQGPAGQ
jgi:hypothetical protein